MSESGQLPEWLDYDAWSGWIEMRDKHRWGLTDRAKKLALMQLAKLRNQGQDPNAVLDQSTLMAWRGLFPVKGENYGARKEKLTGVDLAKHNAKALGFIS